MNQKKLSQSPSESRPGDFELTDAIRPAAQRQVTPKEAFRIGTYRDKGAGLEVPVLAAAVSREKLFEVFLTLLDPLGPVVDVVLETSHQGRGAGHRDLCRRHIDRPVLESYFYEFEDLLLNDGCTGVAVVAIDNPIEVQFDEHKLLIVYARNLKPFAALLAEAGIARDDQMKLITEGEHLHTTEPHHAEGFKQLCYRLGVGETAERVNW